MTAAISDLYPDDLGPQPTDDECKFTVADRAPFDTATPYWEEKARLCKIVASHPEGAYLNQIVAELHGKDEISSGSTEYQRTRRFLNSNPNFFAVRTVNGLITARPTLELLDLIKRGIIQRGPESACTGGSQFEGNRDFAENLLRSIRWDGEEAINDKGRDLLEQNLSEYLDRINDLRLVLHSEDADPEYLTLPYKTRFNDAGRIKKQHAILGNELEAAATEMEYQNAVLLTLTTDPKKFGSVWEMWAGNDDRGTGGINGSWNRFMSWLSSSSRLDGRPDYVKVVEATQKGFPHIHAIVFLDEDQTLPNGMPWLESKGAISDYWNKYQGSIVDVQPLVWQEELPDEYDADEGWVRWDEDGDHGGDLGGEGGAGGEGGQTAGQYLGKYLSAIYGGMRSAAGLEGGGRIMTDGGRDLPADELGDKYEDKAATWKIAMYWATRRKIRTESRDLRQVVEELHEEEEENEDKADVAEQIRQNRYEFVGAYKYGEIPAHVRNGAVPVDSLMQSLEDEGIRDVSPSAGDRPPEKRRVDLLSRTPSSAWGLLPVELEGSGMLFGDDGPGDRADDQDDLADDGLEDEPDLLAYPEDPLTDEERKEAEELGGFDAAGFM